MIRRTVSAAFLLRDGFTGQTMTGGSAVRCLLDGRPLQRPIWKQEGYLILTDLAPGEHELRISRSGYLDELVTLQVTEGAAVEDTICLKPGRGYRFPSETVRVSIYVRRGRNPAPKEKIWLGVLQRTKLVLAQETAAAGDAGARLFCEGIPARFPIPGHFLLTGSKSTELVYLRSLRDETGEFAPPLTKEHARGSELIPVQPYCTDAGGNVQILLREPGTLIGFSDGKLFSSPLNAGAQTLEWDLEV